MPITTKTPHTLKRTSPAKAQHYPLPLYQPTTAVSMEAQQKLDEALRLNYQEDKYFPQQKAQLSNDNRAFIMFMDSTELALYGHSKI
jgi:hypothetical protein